MILAVDIGNSNIVLGCIQGQTIEKEARIATDLIKTSDQYCAELKNMLDLLEVSVSSIEGSIISSVVPPLLNSFKTAIRKLTGLTPLVVGPGIKTGLNILLDNPAIAGGDLIVGAVAALAEYPAPMLIIDMGTATTMDVVDRAGSYIGQGQLPGRLHLPRREDRRGSPELPDGPAAGHQPGSAQEGHRPQYRRFHALRPDDGLRRAARRDD